MPDGNGWTGENRRAQQEREWHDSVVAKIVIPMILVVLTGFGTSLLSAPENMAVQNEQIMTLRRDVDAIKSEFAEFRQRRELSLKEISERLDEVGTTLIELKSDFRNSGIGRRGRDRDDQ